MQQPCDFSRDKMKKWNEGIPAPDRWKKRMMAAGKNGKPEGFFLFLSRRPLVKNWNVDPTRRTPTTQRSRRRCHLESSSRSSNSSRGSNRCSLSRLAISRPVSHTLISTPLFLGGSSKVSSLGHKLGLSSCFSSFTVFLLDLLRVSVEEQVGHDLPRHIPADGTPQPQDLPCQHPPHQTQALRALIIARNGNVNELGWRVNVAKCHDWNIGIGSFSNRLMVSPRVTD